MPGAGYTPKGKKVLNCWIGDREKRHLNLRAQEERMTTTQYLRMLIRQDMEAYKQRPAVGSEGGG